MHRLNNRLKKLEIVNTGEPFYIPIFPPFNLDNVYRMMDSWSIERSRSGFLSLLTMGDGAKGTLEYNPKMVKQVKEKLDIVNTEYLAQPQKHEPEKHIYL